MEKAKKKAKILIVDDHPLVREALSAHIASKPGLQICGGADNVTDALKQVSATTPDLVVIDLSLKGGSGLELIKEIKARNEGIKMLVVSMHDESLYAERALHAGAMGYLSKEEASEKVIDAIHRVLQGKIYLTEALSDRILAGATQGTKSSGLSPMARLTDRELEVLELIGKGLKSHQIAKHLHLSPKTIESHRERIKQKLNLTTSGELVRYAVERSLQKMEKAPE